MFLALTAKGFLAIWLVITARLPCDTPRSQTGLHVTSTVLGYASTFRCSETPAEDTEVDEAAPRCSAEDAEVTEDDLDLNEERQRSACSCPVALQARSEFASVVLSAPAAFLSRDLASVPLSLLFEHLNC